MRKNGSHRHQISKLADRQHGHVTRHAIPHAAAAVLACGDDAALSLSASLALWDLGEWPLTMEVTAPQERRRPGIRCHCSRSLSGRDVRRRHGIRVTFPARTILARCSSAKRLLGEHPEEQRPTRSVLEDRFRRFVGRHKLPMPEINAVVNARADH